MSISPKCIPGLILISLGFLFSGCEAPSDSLPTLAPDERSRLAADEAVVSSAHPLASEAGVQMLEQGGNAIDAAIATAFALSVVEPNMSGIGGGGSVLIWMDEDKSAHYGDFYPAKLAESYKDLDTDEIDDDFNLLSTGIPGTVDGLLEALERHGNLTRTEVLQPAIDIANEGFPVYLTLAEFIEGNETKLTRFQETADTFWPDGEPLKPGEILRLPEMGDLITEIRENGRSAFYEGQNAEALVEVLNEHGNPIGIEDVENYESQWDKNVLCGEFNDHTVLSAPPPQTGMQIIHTLNLLDQQDLSEKGLPTRSSDSFEIIASALRAGMADRSEYISDPKWTHVPATGMISAEYAQHRSELVGNREAPDSIAYGNPAEFNQAGTPEECDRYELYTGEEEWAVRYESASEPVENDDSDSGETTHISVVDADGNAVTLSTTLSPVFGSGAWVNGYLLNTSGYNFEHMADVEEWEGNHPYRVRASTISPTIILDENEQVRLVIGAPGGGRIPTAIIQNINYMLEYDLEPMEAVRMPRIFPSVNSPEVQIERGFDAQVLNESREMGYDIQTLSPGYARMYLVGRHNDQWIGVADPRHEGSPKGW